MSTEEPRAKKATPSKFKSFRETTWVATALLCGFALGAGFVHWELPAPLSEVDLRSGLDYTGQDSPLDLGPAFLDSVFSGSTIDGELYYPAITDLAGIRAANLRAFVAVTSFEGAYESIEIEMVEQLGVPAASSPVVKILYTFEGESREAFSYGVMPEGCGGGLGSLVIPGSNENQSSPIYAGDPNNYHYGILDVAPDEGLNKRFVLIKQNQDFLAWHDGNGGKLSNDVVFSWHINRGGSYSVSYLVDSLAFSKWMRACFIETAIVGLSQGAAATLVTSLQAQPDFAVVASGHSTIFRDVLPAGPDQLVAVPGYFELFRESSLIDEISRSHTKWIFTWGTLEPGIYGFEARGGPTYRVLEPLDNVAVFGHNSGHQIPAVELADFLKLNSRFH